MNKPPVFGAFVTFSMVAALAATPFLSGPSHSQRPSRPHVSAPAPVMAPPPVTSATPVNVTPTVVLPAPVNSTIPRIVPPSRVVAMPAKNIAHTVVPGSGPRLEAETSDCSIHRFECAESCDPLPNGFSSYRDCVKHRCRQVEENCIEKLVQQLQSRRSDNELTVHFKSNYRTKVQLAFYSRNRDVAWPGSGGVYENNDYDTHIFRLKCNSGEKICYGAETMDHALYWGVGLGNRYSCVGCCAQCAGQSVTFTIK